MAEFASSPEPPSERGAWLLAGAVLVAGLTALTLALTGVVGGARAAVAPPAVPVKTVTPAPASSAAASDAAARGAGSTRAAIVARPGDQPERIGAGSLLGATEVHIAKRWMEGFYPIYATAQSTFGVNWLLIASIHRQETAFSTAPGTYQGLNFAHCCGGPMQFNVRNGGAGAPSTWDLVRGSYRYGRRPSAYDHMTARHPSIYDDFDAIMAAAHLLSTDGAGARLDGSAWQAAYDYYGHGEEGVAYADQVLARAIGWSQHGFCINCGVESSLVQAVYAAYGRPVLEALEAEAAKPAAAGKAKPGRPAGRRGTGTGRTAAAVRRPAPGR